MEFSLPEAITLNFQQLMPNYLFLMKGWHDPISVQSLSHLKGLPQRIALALNSQITKLGLSVLFTRSTAELGIYQFQATKFVFLIYIAITAIYVLRKLSAAIYIGINMHSRNIKDKNDKHRHKCTILSRSFCVCVCVYGWIMNVDEFYLVILTACDRWDEIWFCIYFSFMCRRHVGLE